MSDNWTESTYIVVTDPVTGWRTPVSPAAIQKAADMARFARPSMIQSPPNPNEHPGVDCCDSCIEDAAIDSIYSMWPQCCCLSEISAEWLESYYSRKDRD